MGIKFSEDVQIGCAVGFLVNEVRMMEMRCRRGKWVTAGMLHCNPGQKIVAYSNIQSILALLNYIHDVKTAIKNFVVTYFASYEGS